MFFFLADTPQKVDHVNRATCFAYSCMSSVQLVRNSAISSSGSCGRHFFLIHSGINSYEPTTFTFERVRVIWLWVFHRDYGDRIFFLTYKGVDFRLRIIRLERCFFSAEILSPRYFC